MAKTTNQVSKNASWAIIQTVISAAVLFILYRFLLKTLGAEKLGLWSLILASTSLAKIGELGFSTATLRFVGKYFGAGQREEAAEVLQTALLSIAPPFAALTLIAIPAIGGVLPWFVPEKHMADAHAILPWAMAALWLSISSGLVQSAIDGCGRMDQRNMVLIVTNIIYLALGVVLTPVLGLQGIAIAQVVQAAASLLITWWLIRKQLSSLPMIPRRWSKPRLYEIAGFALSMQVGSIAGMFVEPATKALLSRFGGLGFLAYYEMANQVITRARSVLVSGFQAIVPQFSITNQETAHRELFCQSQRKVIDIGTPFMCVLVIFFPLLSQIWIGRTEADFITSGQLLGITWLLNTLLTPAYFFLTGTGCGLSVAVAQVLTLAGTLMLGWAGGLINGKFGPIAGAAIALLLGNVYLYKVAANALFRRNNVLSVPDWIGSRILKSLGICSLIVVSGNFLTKSTDNVFYHSAIFMALAATISLIALASHTKSRD